MADGTIQDRAGRVQAAAPRRRSRRVWIAYAIPIALLILRAVFEFAFDGLTGKIVNRLDSLLGNSTIAMATAGWLTLALLPLAVHIFVRDRERRLGRAVPVPASIDDTGVIHMTTRERAEIGHRIAPRSVTHWIRRAPMVLAFLVAVLFWPLTGASMASRWMATAGGVAFSHGWRISLVAAALGILVILAEPWIHNRKAVRIAVIVLPMVALAVTLIVA